MTLGGGGWEMGGALESSRLGLYMTVSHIKCRVFQERCTHHGHIPFHCSVGVILSFLQDLIDKCRAFSIKVYLVASAACHIGFGFGFSCR